MIEIQILPFTLINQVTSKNCCWIICSESSQTKPLYFPISDMIFTALHTLVDRNELPPAAKKTAEFVQTMNDVFDLLNSSSPFGFGFRRAITPESCEADMKQLKEWSAWIGKWRFTERIEGSQRASLPFQKGFDVTISGLEQLVRRCFVLGLSHVCTRYLNQDCLEVNYI